MMNVVVCELFLLKLVGLKAELLQQICFLLLLHMLELE